MGATAATTGTGREEKRMSLTEGTTTLYFELLSLDGFSREEVLAAAWTEADKEGWTRIGEPRQAEHGYRRAGKGWTEYALYKVAAYDLDPAPETPPAAV
jgi:hypothetical protein